MARPDSLEQDSLTPERFGHCPALWLALPLLLGCSADAWFGLDPGPWLLCGFLASVFAWTSRRHAFLSGVLLVVAGTTLGAAWHHLRTPPQEAVVVRRPFVELPVMIDRDLSATYNGVTYWLEGLSFTTQVRYAARSLQFLDAPYLAQPGSMTVDQPSVGTVVIHVQGADSVRSGPLARLRFLVTVPEFAQTDVSVAAAGFISDSLQFLDVVPSGAATPFVTSGECRLTVLNFSTPAPSSIRVLPHPVHDDATVRFTMAETVPVTLHLLNTQGVVVRELLDGSQRLVGGEYQADFSTRDLPSAVYYLRIAAGVFTSTIPVVVVH